MPAFKLKDEIRAISQYLYHRFPNTLQHNLPPFSTHPLLTQHSYINAWRHSEQNPVMVGDIHENFKCNNYEHKAIPILKTITPSIDVMAVLKAVIFDAESLTRQQQDQPMSFGLQKQFVDGLSAFMTKNRQTKQDYQAQVIELLRRPFNLNQSQMLETYQSLDEVFIDTYGQNIESAFFQATNDLNAVDDSNTDQQNNHTNKFINVLHKKLWQHTLSFIIDYFEAQPINTLYPVASLYEKIQTYHQNHILAINHESNPTLASQLVEALIGDDANDYVTVKHLQSNLAMAWELNTTYPETQSGLVTFICDRTGLDHKLIQSCIEKYDAHNAQPTHVKTGQTASADHDYVKAIRSFKYHIHKTKDELLSHFLTNIGLVKRYDVETTPYTLEQLAHFDQAGFAKWIRLQTQLHLVDFKLRYLELVDDNPKHFGVFRSHIKYHWTTNFYWMMLNVCQETPGIDTHQFFFKILTDCLVATANDYKCYQGVYEDAIISTPSLYQAYYPNTVIKADAYQIITSIVERLLDNGIQVFNGDGINPDLFHWLHIRQKKSEITWIDTTQTLNEYGFLFPNENKTTKLILLSIREMFIKDLFELTNLNMDTCVALADYLNMYYKINRTSGPDTLWALMRQYAVDSDETDLKAVRQRLFEPLTTQIKTLPGLYQALLTLPDEALPEPYSPLVDIGLLKDHEIDVKNLRQKLSNKKIRLLLAIEPKAFFNLPTNITNDTERFKTCLFNLATDKLNHLSHQDQLAYYVWAIVKLDKEPTYFPPTYFNRIANSPFKIITNIDAKTDLFFNILLDQLTSNQHQTLNEDDNLLHNFKVTLRVFNLVSTKLDIDLDLCHEHLTELLNNINFECPILKTFTLTWTCLYKQVDTQTKNNLFKAYQDPNFRKSLCINQASVASFILQLMPDKLIPIINTYIDDLPETAQINIKSNPIFYNHKHSAGPIGNIPNWEVKWLYFMHCLKGRSDLDPIRQALCRDLENDMQITLNRYESYINNHFFGVDGVTHFKLLDIHYVMRWLYQSALNKPETHSLHHSHISLLASMIQSCNWLSKLWPYSRLVDTDNQTILTLFEQISTTNSNPMLMLETYIQAEVLDIETKLSLCQELSFLTDLIYPTTLYHPPH